MSFFVFAFLLVAIIYLLSRVRFLHLAHADDLRDLRAEITVLRQKLDQHSAPAVRPARPGAEAIKETGEDMAPVNLNTASKTALQRIPKVGAACARRVMDARPLPDLNALDAIEGLTGEQRTQLRRFGTV